MRRLWAYILLAVTSLVLVGVSFAPMISKANSNMDYQPGRELIFRVYEKEGDGSEALTKDGLENVASIMEERLENQGVSRYQVNIEGEDTITVTLSQDYESNYNNIVSYMEFDGSFGLTNSAGDFALADEFLTDDKAFIDSINSYPCIVLPVNVENDQYKNVFSRAKSEDAKAETVSTDDDGNEETAYFLYLWYGFDEEEYQKPDVDYNDEKILMKIRVQDDEADQYFGSSDNQLYSIINLDANEDGTATFTEKKQAYDRANFFVNLLNASELDYNVKLVGSNYVDSWIEDLIYRGDVAMVNLSATLMALISAIILVSLILVYFYKLGAISVIVTSIVSVFAGLCAMVLLTAEYNTIAIFGFVAVALASIASGVIYLNKIKDEAYRGRSLKKANLEGGKKALLPVADVNVVLIIVGVFCYILGGSALRSFAAVTVLGGIASLLLNTLGLKILLWLATNATCVVGKYHLFGIEDEKVPDLLSEDKQVYNGPYAEVDLTKTKKKMSIFGGILFVASLVCMIVFASLNNGAIYSQIQNGQTSKVYFETTAVESSSLDESAIRDILGKTFTFVDSNDNGVLDTNEKSTCLGGENIVSIDNKDKTYTVTVDDEDKVYNVFIVNLKSYISPEAKACYKVSDTEIIYQGDNSLTDVNSILSFAISEKDILEHDATISLKTVRTYSVSEPKVLPIILASLVGVLVSGLYLILRYRLSRGLAATALALAAGTIAMGFLSMIHIQTTSVAAILAPMTILVAFIAAIMFMNRERELIIDDRSRDNSLEKRKELSIKATSYAYTSVYTFIFAAALIGISFFGFGSKATALPYMGLCLLLLLVVVIIPPVFMPLANALYALTSKIKVGRPNKKKKAKKAHKVNKSAEPEEAIFIGIND
ncbi:MAG: hypothetical protein K6C32_02625 [Bacilli bacterium]|nr:hypothetical protein [Bacilli bacterium]